VSSTTSTLLAVGGGAAALWAVSRWAKKRDDSDAEWGAQHDEAEVAPTLEHVSVEGPRGLTREFDPIFAAHGLGLPVPYLRALAARESGLRANDPKGLINVVSVVRDDFNRRHGTAIKARDLTDPSISLMVASDTLRRIIASYARYHAGVPNLRENWTNRHFVELLTFGWNAGYSESKGVGRVVRYLVERGARDVTLTDVARAAHEAGASQWLWAHPKKVAWTRSVADLYERELARDVRAGRVPAPQPTTTAPPPPRPNTAVAFDLGRPVPDDVRAIVSSGWSRPRGDRLHRALDIPLAVGTPVLAIADGDVIRAQRTPSGDAGIWVAVRHPSGLVSRYLHLSTANVAEGARVRRGDVIGRSGNTGHSTGPHLHLDLRVPITLLPAIARTTGTPRTGWGPELLPYGVSIPGEPWIPVDGYDDAVATEARAAGIALRVPATTSRVDDSPVSTPSQVEA
jgi:murein DD-endopeptidase MepM/ murein hydrolase activator NlpD